MNDKPVNENRVNEGRLNKRRSYAVKAGMLAGAAFGMARFSMARDLNDMLFAAASTTLEIAAIKLLDHRARQLDEEREAWQSANDERGRAEAMVRVAENEVQRCENVAEKTEREICDLENRRDHRAAFSDPEMVVEGAVSAVLSGYLHGVSLNKKRNTFGLGGQQ